MPPTPNLPRRITGLTWFVIVGLLLSGVTAIPLQNELNAISQHRRILRRSFRSADSVVRQAAGGEETRGLGGPRSI